MMLAPPVPPLPEGTPPPHHFQYQQQQQELQDDSTSMTEEDNIGVNNNEMVEAESSVTNDLFLYKARDCKSAPAPPTRNLENFGESEDDDDKGSSSSSSSFSSVSNNEMTSSTAKFKRAKSASRRCLKTCSCLGVCSYMYGFIFGHAPAFTAWSTSYSSTSRLKYLALFFLEASLRSIGDVTFCSNPFSGLLIFSAMLIACPLVAFLGFVTLTIGIETAVVFLHVPMEEVRSGGVTFNNFLTGTVIGLIAQQDVILAKPDIIATCLGIGILTVIIWKGVNGILAMKYLDFPLLNLPFHLMILLYFYSGIVSRYQPVDAGHHNAGQNGAAQEGIQSEQLAIINATASSPMHYHHPTTTEMPFGPLDMDKGQTFVEPLNWGKICCGVFLAPSHVFGTKSIATCGMVHLAVLLYSPIMLLQCLTGSAIGTLLGICLTNPDEWETLYEGSWGYNPLFTTAAIGGFLLVFNVHSWLLSIVGAVFTTLLYSALIKCHVPALGMPFMFMTWLLLPSTTSPPILAQGNDSFEEIVVVKMDNDDVKQAFDDNSGKKDNGEDNVKKREQGKVESLSTHFIRLPLCKITTPEGNRNNFLPKTQKKDRKIREDRRASKHKGGGVKDNSGGGGVMGTIKNGVMNKYKASFPETPPSHEQMPTGLVMGLGGNSVLPL